MAVEPYFKDEYVTLYHGDCLEQTAWLKADVLVTDPPYGIGFRKRGTYGGDMGGKGAIETRNFIASDKDTFTRDSVIELWGEKPAIMFGTSRIPRPHKTNHVLIWNKAGMPPGPLNAAFISQHEEIYVWGNGFRKSSPPLRSVITTNEHRPTAVRKAGHPTPKPIDLMEKLVDRCIQGVIADPFAGSGATLIAARNLGKKVIGVEVDEKYCEIIAKALSQQLLQFGGV